MISLLLRWGLKTSREKRGANLVEEESENASIALVPRPSVRVGRRVEYSATISVLLQNTVNTVSRRYCHSSMKRKSEEMGTDFSSTMLPVKNSFDPSEQPG